MINGIGVLALGRGRAGGGKASLGFPVTIRTLDVVGVRSTGRLFSWRQSTDLALDATHLRRRHKISGEFVEFSAGCVSTLTGGDCAVIAK
ncbi:aconitase family protein [Sinorhizobium psoraleae]|uniref:Aconitase family protein n=1 Tax=Sinorhizobium psoraleae TaxID=520838 RepID=A0ABT4KC73_9HYPH|nr:aconitase family protein [Sinorhizobium psoraleae]MCZ4088587.1 aconitase family protein [Sinorhizobium psoraleae]